MCHNIYIWEECNVFAMRYKRIGNKIRYYRKDRNFEQVDFAQKIGITPQYLSKIECGYAKPSMDLMFRISECLDIDVAELFKKTDV